jgi:hypothetical protein
MSEINKNQKPDMLVLASLIDIALGAIGLIVGLLFLPSLPSILDGTYISDHMGFNNDFMSIMMGFMVISLILVGIPLVIAGIAMNQGYKWSRLLHTLSWIPLLFMFPIGTFIGIFSIWLVYTKEVSEYFNSLV